MDDIALWAGDFDKPPVYWLNGLAGTGKSAIAQTVAERLAADGRLGASFFCSRDSKERRDLKLIFPTLAVQLATKYHKIRSIVVRLVRSVPDIPLRPLTNQAEDLIFFPLRKSGTSTVIVIDALDECKGHTSERNSEILSILGRFSSEIPNVKFFITGRPEPLIRRGFRRSPLAEATNLFVLHEIGRDRVDSDIRLFFRHEFSKLANRPLGPGDWPTEKHLDLLCQRAAGLFVYAAATAKFIGRQSSCPEMQLKRILECPESTAHEGCTRLASADATLDSLYMSILRDGFPLCGDNQKRYQRVRSVLGAVVLASNPLSPSTIATLLGDQNATNPLEALHSILNFKDRDHPTWPFHKSFPDFIIDPTRCIDQRFHVSPPVHHSELLMGCLELMSQLEKNMCKLRDGVANSEVSGLKERTERCIDPALQYACESWHKHLVHAARTPEVISVLHRFLKDKFLFWLEVISVLGSVRSAAHSLGATKKWLGQVCLVSGRNAWLVFTQTRMIHQILSSSLTTVSVS